MRRTPVFLLLLLLVVPAVADEKEPAPPPPLTEEQAADAALAAFGSKDAAALKALAEKDEPDPWLAADLLAHRGEHTAAVAFARSAPRADTEALPGYIVVQRERDPDDGARALLERMNAAAHERAFEQILEGTGALEAEARSVVQIRLLHVRGTALRGLGRLGESESVFAKAGAAAAAIGWLRRAARLYHEAGSSAYQAAAGARVIAAWEKALALEERRGNRAGAARMLTELGHVANRMGHLPAAQGYFERALSTRQSLKDAGGVAQSLGSLGVVHLHKGDPARALTFFERALAAMEAQGDRAGAAGTLINLGTVYRTVGEYGKALSSLQRGLALAQEIGHAPWTTNALIGLGNVHTDLGDYAKALSLHERSLELSKELGPGPWRARALGNMAIVHARLGNYAKALAGFERVHAEFRVQGDGIGAAKALINIGSVHLEQGEYEEALETQKRALAAVEAIGDRAAVALTLSNIGLVHKGLGNYDEALAHLERALSAMETLGDKFGVARVLCDIGSVHASRKDEAAARTFFERSARAARSLRATAIFVAVMGNLARLHLEAGRPARALAAAQRGLGAAEEMLGGLDEEQAAQARTQHARIFDAGALAAVREQDPAEALTFLESGRAGALLDALGKREILRWKAESLPPALRAADREAKAAELAARRAYDRAASQGALEERRAAARALEEATAAAGAVAGRIQRRLKQHARQAGLLYPRAKTIHEVQSALASHEALVLYGLCRVGELDEAFALVLRSDSRRIVPLGTSSAIAAACGALDASNPDASVKEALKTLGTLLVGPLKLDAKVSHVLISPQGPLCYVPFAALFDRTVALTPSGTTHVLLRKEERGRGDGVLALGDPDYSGVSEGALAIYFRGRKLVDLPATRSEVDAIGDEKLLGPQASEQGLAQALADGKRRRAVHLACHGLVDAERPMVSALALSRAGDDDGFLTAREILRMQVPADLAVLSACETGKGRLVEGEGIVGLTRAFMFAGAPRVICSLWKVDDEATRALMIKFYGLWNPKEGPSIGAAEALKKAQAFVRGHEKWKHPYYWAAWVLWGLAD